MSTKRWMQKNDVGNIHVTEHHSVIKRNEIAVCSSTDGPRNHHEKQSQAGRERHTQWTSLTCGAWSTTQMDAAMNQDSPTSRTDFRLLGGGGEGRTGSLGLAEATYFIQNEWQDLTVQHMERQSACCDKPQDKSIGKGIFMHIYQSFCCTAEINTTL